MKRRKEFLILIGALLCTGAAALWLITPREKPPSKLDYILEGEYPELPYTGKVAPVVDLANATAIAREFIPSATKWIMPTSPSTINGRLLWVFRYEAPDNFLGLIQALYIDAKTGKIVYTMSG